MHTEGKQTTEVSEEESQLVGWLVNFHQFIQVDRIGRVEAVVAQRSEFSLYRILESLSGQPVERSDMKRDMVSFGSFQDKTRSAGLNIL